MESPHQPPVAPSMSVPHDGTIAVVLAGVSLFFPPVAPVAVWFGVRGRRLTDESQRTLATIGLAVGAVLSALLVLAVLFFVFVMVVFATGSFTY